MRQVYRICRIYKMINYCLTFLFQVTAAHEQNSICLVGALSEGDLHGQYRQRRVLKELYRMLAAFRQDIIGDGGEYFICSNEIGQVMKFSISTIILSWPNADSC